MRADINRVYLLSAHADADNKNHYPLVWIQIVVLGYADVDNIYIFHLWYLDNLCFLC
jgi:hypothetical protein